MKEGYKNTELGWIPETWNLIRIGELVKILKSGLSRSLKDENIGIPCIRSNNIKNNRLVLDDLKYWMRVDNKGAKIEDYILDEGDIIINFINSISQIGKGCIFNRNDFETIYTTNLLRIKVKEDKINNKYFYYYTQTERYKKEISLITKPAVNQASFTTVEYKAIKFPVPPLKEQEKIADILSTVDSQIDDTDKLIEKTKELKKGLMQRLLTNGIGHTEFKKTEVGEIPVEWQVKKFSDVSKINQGLQIAIQDRYKEISKNRLPYITIQYINDKANVENQFFIENANDSVICRENDILMTRTGNTGVVVTNEYGVFHNNFFKVNFDKRILNKDFLVYYLKSKFIQRLIINYAGTTTIPDLKHKDFYRLPISIPIIEEQEKISDILLAVDNQIWGYENKKVKLNELKKGLMQQLLTGKIRTI